MAAKTGVLGEKKAAWSNIIPEINTCGFEPPLHIAWRATKGTADSYNPRPWGNDI
jgi:hypothetical protein